MTRYAKRVDGNHAEIRAEFRRLLGTERVIDTSRFGSPFGDLAITAGRIVRLVETKTRLGRLTAAQERETLPYVLVREVKDCAAVVACLERDLADVVEGRKRRLAAQQ